VIHVPMYPVAVIVIFAFWWYSRQRTERELFTFFSFSRLFFL